MQQTLARSRVRILFLDIETLPNVGYTWGKYEQNVISFRQEGCLATYAAKWAGGKVFAKALPDYRGYRADSYDDSKICADLWKLLNEADIVVAHNGDQFDVKVTNSRFIYNKLPPPAPYKTVDTKKVIKRVSRFNSNKLDDLGELLGEGRKIKTDFSLWLGCIAGDKKCWDKMVKYNKQDVLLLERVYERLLPWAKNHPNIGAIANCRVCPKCGGTAFQKRGMALTTTMKYTRLQCKTCGGWTRETVNGMKSTSLANL